MERDLAGETIAGRYDVLELIGRGGMGAVYRAHDRELDELVALKVIRPDRTGPTMLESFRHEVKLARRVTHVNIARTFELGFADGVMFCTMELVEGESLRRRLERQRRLPAEQAAAITRALCDGLAVAHAAGVIHRDIKPDNVLLARDGRVVLADFGVASLTAGTQGALSGTLEYMAPEQAAGEPPTPAADVYALGLVLYEMLTGLRAFSGSMSELIVAKQDVERVTFDIADVMLGADAVPPALRELVSRATARDLRERIATARELGQLLAPWLGEEAVIEHRRPSAPHLLHTVVVLAPRAAGDASRLHVAEGVHQELLRQLVSRPRMRVLPRQASASVPEDSTVVAMTADGEGLTVEIRHDDDAAATTLQLPLEMRTIRVAADAIAAAVAELGEHAGADEVTELLLRARTVARRGFAGVAPAVDLLERARTLAPGDWTIAAELASIRARFRLLDEAHFERTAALVREVRTAAPGLAASHVAAGYLELHTGEPHAAAAEFRRAIACSPYHAAGHEGLGRMLLEAGFLRDAEARLDDALSIAPDLTAVRWEIARAHALEQNWFVHDQLVADLTRDDWRTFERLRFAWWRGDRATMLAVRQRLHAGAVRPGFSPDLVERLFEVALDGAWAAHRDFVLAKVTQPHVARSQRAAALFSQIAAEAAGASGDVETCLAMLARASEQRLFDLHWLERCPLIEPARRTAAWPAIHACVKERADAILDALYGGDQTVATNRT